MPSDKAAELPFSARYSLPVQVADNLDEVSWETVVQLSTDFQFRSEEKRTRVKRLIRELQMSRLLLMARIKRNTRQGSVDPKILIDLVRLLQRCEQVMGEYDVDLKDFSSFVYLLIEKLKKEKLAKHSGEREMGRMRPIQDELASFKARAEPLERVKSGRKAAKARLKKKGK